MRASENNPFQSPHSPSTEGSMIQEPRPSKPKTRWVLLIGLAIVAFLVIGLTVFPMRPNVREAAIRAQCQNNLRQLAVGLLNYEQAHGSLPPQYTVDESGRPLHSWRVLILPYVEGHELYESIDLDKPWDDRVNAHARKTAPDVYRCPGVKLKPELTNYLANAWDQGAFSGGTGRRTADFAGGTSQTVLVFEVTADQAVEWMSPYDGNYESLIQTLSSTQKLPHVDLVNLALADGSAHTIKRLPEELSEDRRRQARQRLIDLFSIDQKAGDGLSFLHWPWEAWE